MSTWQPVILKGASALIDGITFSDPGTGLFLKSDASESGAASSAALKNSLSGRIGDLLTVRLIEVVSPEKLLLEVAGTEVVARGSAPPGTSAGLFTVRLESLEPLLQFSLVDQDDSGLPLSSRQLLREVVANPNFFSKNIILLKELLLDENVRLPASMLDSLKSLTSRFSAATLISELRSGDGLPLKQLGFFHEPELAALLSVEPGKLSLATARKPATVKANLLQLLSRLQGGFVDELPVEGGPEAKSVAKLSSGLRSLLDMVELNQYLNNPGLRSADDFILLLPLWGWGSAGDLWLRLRQEGGEANASAGNLYTMMFYLDLEDLGPLGAQVIVGSKELQVKLMVVGDESAHSVRELLPETRKQLRSRFSDGVRLTVESVGPHGVEAFRQRAFLASLPSLFTASG